MYRNQSYHLASHQETHLFHHVPRKPVVGFWSWKDWRRAMASASVLPRLWFTRPAKSAPGGPWEAAVEFDELCFDTGLGITYANCYIKAERE